MQNSEMDYSAEYRPVNPLMAFVTFLLGLLLLIIVVAGLIAGWHTFLSESSIIVQVIVILVLIAIPVAVIAIGLHKGYTAWLATQLQREQLAAVRDSRHMAIERHELEMELARTRIEADDRGNRPIVLYGGQFHQFESGNFAQPVPQTYSPHITHAAPGRIEQVTEVDQAALPAPEISQPTMQYVLSQLEENGLQVCLGVNATTGKPFVLDLLAGVHYKFIGSSGMGKSCMAGSLLEQATKLNSPDNLMISLLDLEHKTSRLFEHLPHVAQLHVGRRIVDSVATDADEVAEHLGYLRSELDRRKVLSEYELNQQRFMLIYVEEFLSLRLEVDEDLKAQMLADFSILAVRGRKYGMYLLACAQDDYADDSLKSAKNQFRVKGAFGIPPTAAQSAGFMMKDLIKQNYMAQTPGQYVLETSGCMATMLAPVYDVKAKLARLAPARSMPSAAYTEPNTQPKLRLVSDVNTDRTPAVSESNERRTPPLQADLPHTEEVKYLRSLNWGKQAIVEKVWNVKKGSSRAYHAAVTDYETIVAHMEREAGA